MIGFVLVAGFFAINYGFTNTKGVIDTQHDYFKKPYFEKAQVTNTTAAALESTKIEVSPSQPPPWASDAEWQVLQEAIKKDQKPIFEAAQRVSIDPRLIVSNLVVEQLRLFHSDREIFKQVFLPLKILGTQTQFSWGAMGIKESTAIDIERNLKNSRSSFYLGPEYEHMLDFTTTNQDQERFERLTDPTSRAYSYLYAAIYIKEILTQWKNAGFDISKQPAILSTLYNIGLSHSKPSASPEVGGASIDIDGTSYSFGSLGYEFYYSNELTAEFPRVE